MVHLSVTSMVKHLALSSTLVQSMETSPLQAKIYTILLNLQTVAL